MALNEIDRQVAMVAQFHLAKRSVESMQTYLASGRCFQALSNEQLQKRYVHIMQQWASAPAGSVSRRLAEDVHSEYELRDLLPPQNLVLAELKQIGLAVARLYEELPEDRKEEIGAEIFEDYESAKKDRHETGTLCRSATVLASRVGRTETPPPKRAPPPVGVTQSSRAL